MPNPENIKVNRSPNEARKNGKKGGIASGKARRLKKTMRELLDIAMSEVVKNPKTGEIKTRDEWAAAALATRAMKGDVTAYRTVAEMRGENPAHKVDVTSGGMMIQPITVEIIDKREQIDTTDEDTNNQSI